MCSVFRLFAALLMLVALFGAAQSAASQDEVAPPETTDSVAEVDSQDALIEQRLETIFGLVDDLETIEVSVQNGVVHIEGRTPSGELRDKAEELAASIDGVVFVDNDIEQSQEVGERIAPTFDRFYKLIERIIGMGPLLGLALVVMIVAFVIARVLRRWDAPFGLVTRNKLIEGVVQQIAALLVLLIGLVIALELLDATAFVGAVFGAAGVLGLAIGFAFRDIVENYLASILLGLRRPFAVNDLVDIDGHEGFVVRLNMRETILMTPDGNHVRLPNALVFKSVMTNYTRNPLRRFDFMVGVGTEEDLSDVQRICLHTLRDTPGVIPDPPCFTRVEKLGDSNVTVQCFGWTDQREYDVTKVNSEAIRRTKTALDQAGVDMPAPIYRVELERVIDAIVDDAIEDRQEAQRPKKSPVDAAEVEDAAHEVKADDALARQIQADEALSEEENLLED